MQNTIAPPSLANNNRRLFIIRTIKGVDSIGVNMCLTKWSIPFICLLFVSTPALAQDKAADAATIAQERQDALNWLEAYAGDELLLKPADLQKLISEIKEMPDDAFEKWYNQTRQLRAMLDSPEWKATRAWLRDYLKVQAIYSDSEIAEFQADVAKMTPSQLIEVMRRLERKHQSLIAMQQVSDKNRQLSMNLRNELVASQKSAMAPVGGSNYGSRNVQSYFGPSSSGPAKSSYAQRQNSYRRNLGVIPGGAGWWRW